ncbi:glutathione S-transferase [Litoreibacter ponti]|uniref:Glutathione S-transferase n=1 Tax=Litoreibacter ponti TaxID=1510457 RepID=A0A2T6BI41_9RHOB|nr:glutathione S-transferase family protein [Litoreibacter ponti]PTX55725.1 glutathione S-transferase [Litoreibacter ponti]
MRLHLAKGTIALAAHIALEESGLAFDLVWVDFATGEQRTEAYLAINPKGRVPALETDHGILTETSAMLGLIAEMAPEAGLMPGDMWARAKVAELHLFLAATMHVNHAHKMRGSRWADDPAAHKAMQAKVTENMTDNAALIERDYLRGPWVLGAQYSTADIYLYTIARWLEGDGVDLAPFPTLRAHMGAMEARPAVEKAIALHI